MLRIDSLTPLNPFKYVAAVKVIDNSKASYQITLNPSSFLWLWELRS